MSLISPFGSVWFGIVCFDLLWFSLVCLDLVLSDAASRPGAKVGENILSDLRVSIGIEMETWTKKKAAGHLRTLPQRPHEENELVELQHAIAVQVHLSQLVLDV